MSSSIVVNFISKVVDAVRLEYDKANPTPEKPYFKHGHIQEIINTLTEQDASKTYKFKKYPLIALIQDLDEVDNETTIDATITIFIITDTRREYKAADRYLHIFDPILSPIANLFIDELRYATGLNQLEVSIPKRDMLYLGANDNGIGNDYLDAIKIENLKLSLLKDC